ncbi:MAG: hypothetical protein H0W98_09295 [Chloroflexi bacterium]|nr:hypothetical protein [Chloroflexota bacterium]
MSTPVALPATSAPGDPPVDRETHRRLATRVKVLSWAGLVCMTVEGSIAILAAPSPAPSR